MTKRWIDIIHEWEKGTPFTYPKKYKDTNKKIKWNTSVLTHNGTSIFKQKFAIDKHLPYMQDYSSFQDKIDDYLKEQQKDNIHKVKPDVIDFLNKSKDTLLIIPTPVENKNFATIKDFVDNASPEHQQTFWKKVAKILKSNMKDNTQLWVSTHGLGVAYFHLRVSIKPKYYFSEKLKSTLK